MNSRIDPKKLKDKRYTTHENFIDQIALTDVLVANKIEQTDQESLTLFQQWVKKSEPEKVVVAQTTHGQLNIDWLDYKRNEKRQAIYPDFHSDKDEFEEKDSQNQSTKSDGFLSFGKIFSENDCFDYKALKAGLKSLQAERVKGIFNTNKGWFVVNNSNDIFEMTPCEISNDSRVEIILRIDQPEVQVDYFQKFIIRQNKKSFMSDLAINSDC